MYLYLTMVLNSARTPFGYLPLITILLTQQALPGTHALPGSGEVQRAVRTVRSLLSKNQDPYPSLLAYRSQPLQNGFSPSELLMGRRLRTKVPLIPTILKPNVHDTDWQRVQEKDDEYRSKQQINHNKRYRAHDSDHKRACVCATLKPGRSYRRKSNTA